MKRFLVGAAIVIGAFVAVGCAGGGGSATATATATRTASTPTAASPTATATPASTPAPAPNRFDPSKADALAHASLIAATDLPGGGWTVSKRDNFAQSAPSTSAVCAPVATAQKAFQTALDANRAGRAEIELSKTAATSPLPATAEFVVYIYQDGNGPVAPLAAHRGLFDADAFAKCLEEETAGFAAKVTKVSPAVSAPNNGTSAAFDLAITAGSIILTLRIETYAWQSGNALAGVNLAGPKDVVTTDLATAAVGKLRAAMEAAASAR